MTVLLIIFVLFMMGPFPLICAGFPFKSIMCLFGRHKFDHEPKPGNVGIRRCVREAEHGSRCLHLEVYNHTGDIYEN